MQQELPEEQLKRYLGLGEGTPRRGMLCAMTCGWASPQLPAAAPGLALDGLTITALRLVPPVSLPELPISLAELCRVPSLPDRKEFW